MFFNKRSSFAKASADFRGKTSELVKLLVTGVGATAGAVATYNLAKVLFKNPEDYPQVYWSDEDTFIGDLDPKAKLIVGFATLATAYVTLKLSKNCYDSFKKLFNLEKEKREKKLGVVDKIKNVLKKGLE